MLMSDIFFPKVMGMASKQKKEFYCASSIQVEGAFGVLKQDMGSRRFLLRRKAKVQTESLLLALAFNINKLHSRIQSNRCGAHMHVSKALNQKLVMLMRTFPCSRMPKSGFKSEKA